METSCARVMVPGPSPSHPVRAANEPSVGSLRKNPKPGSMPLPSTVSGKKGTARSWAIQPPKLPVSKLGFRNPHAESSEQSISLHVELSYHSAAGGQATCSVSVHVPAAESQHAPTGGQDTSLQAAPSDH